MAENGTVQVLIPTPLRRYTGGSAKVEGSGSSIADVLDDLNVNYPGSKRQGLRRGWRDSPLRQCLRQRRKRPEAGRRSDTGQTG